MYSASSTHTEGVTSSMKPLIGLRRSSNTVHTLLERTTMSEATCSYSSSPACYKFPRKYVNASGTYSRNGFRNVLVSKRIPFLWQLEFLQQSLLIWWTVGTSKRSFRCNVKMAHGETRGFSKLQKPLCEFATMAQRLPWPFTLSNGSSPELQSRQINRHTLVKTL